MLSFSLISRWATGLAATLLVLLFAALPFLLACFEVYGNDIWWHLRGGQWILDNRRTPDLDPFSFGSADQRWIDLHWLFQVIVALVHRAGGMAGVLIVVATAATIAFLIALAARPENAPLPLVLLILLPGLMLANFRFEPRPEIFTLLYLSSFLGVLFHVEKRPLLAWLLPPIQLLWVNMHGMFVFGPIVLGLWWFAWAARRKWRSARSSDQPIDNPRMVKHLGIASGVVLLCCLLNPYGLEGTLLPLKLYPKVTETGNPYKDHIEEFMSPRRYATWASAQRISGGVWFLGILQFTLLLVPASILLPAIWSASRPEPNELQEVTAKPLDSPVIWLGALLAIVGILLLQMVGPMWPDSSGMIPEAAQAAPLLILGLFATGALVLRRHKSAAILCFMGGIWLAAWSYWLTTYLGTDAPLQEILIIAGLAGVIACALVLRQGGNLFAMLLVAAFGFLALQSVNSLGRFGLVAGIVLCWNLGGWVGLLLKNWPSVAGRPATNWVCRLVMMAVLAVCILAVASERYAGWIGDPRHLRLDEVPLAFAHDAARFAGQPGLPKRALVYDLAQACVYVYHNAPEGKVYMDARLETPTQRTFQRYLDIEKQLSKSGGNWPSDLDEFGDVVLLLSHDGHTKAEANIMTNPRWRCVYFDAIAAVFVMRGDNERERQFPTFDPAGRHFNGSLAPSLADEKGIAWWEARAAYEIGAAFRRKGGTLWEQRIPWLLFALHRLEQTIREQPDSVDTWTTMGECYAALITDTGRSPGGLHQAWDPTKDLAWSKATYCFRQALERMPGNDRGLQLLFRSFGQRQFLDAQREIGVKLLDTGKVSKEQGKAIRNLLDQVPPRLAPAVKRGQDGTETVVQLLNANRPREATLVAEVTGPSLGKGWSWPVADRLAGAWMHLGYPRKAREVWEQAPTPPSEAVRLERLASTYWVESDLDEAIKLYTKAWAADSQRPEPGWSLAWLYTEKGNAAAGLAACRDLEQLNLTASLREEIGHLTQLLLRSGTRAGQ
jgi:hypothetical protein